MKKGVRAHLAEIERQGLTLVAVNVTGAKHIKARVERDGRTAQVVISGSPPDAGGALRAFRALLRRFAAQRPAVRQ